MLFRLILYGIVAYILWKVIKVFTAPRPGNGQRGAPASRPSPPSGSTPAKFTDIKDAEFEEIPPKKGE